MKSIESTVKNEIIIEKSRFITYLFNVHTVDEVKEILSNLKKKYVDATHIVYAFIIDTDSRSNDNGEPKGTAGIPTLEVLRKENLTNILAVTVRYFGGIKLGAGGLLRAYTRGVSEALKLSTLTTETKVSYIKLVVTYKDASYLDKNLSLIKSVNKEYDTSVIYNITLLSSNLDSFKELFINLKDKYEYTFIEEKVEFIWWRKHYY